jgi:DnaA-homolog protein
MKQLVLDVAPQLGPTLDNFVPGRNRELVETLHDLLSGRSSERFVYVWGESGAGKTHLLQAFAARTGARYLAADWADDIATLDAQGALAIDDVQRLGDHEQLELFRLYNAMRAGTGTLLASGQRAPTELRLRPELASRLAWGLTFQVQALSDGEKLAALTQHAQARGFVLASEVAQYMLTHCARDMLSLMKLVAALDRYSLEHQRSITVPLLREILQGEINRET